MFSNGITSVTTGAILMVSMRWTDRLIGFASTLILARLLLPEDFGIIAMASLVVGLIDVLLTLSVNVALIQNKNATQEHYDTAWTLRLAQTCLAGLIIFILAPFAADYFGDERISDVLKVMGATLPLVGLENIGIITYQKEMRFGLDFRFVFSKRMAGFVVTMAMVWVLESYWAMVIGSVAGRTIGVVLSYTMHPMRPKLGITKIREIFAISQWMLVKSVGHYLHLNLHKVLAGRQASVGMLGGYTLADEISAMPSTEVLAPINRVLFPAFVAALSDLTELKRIFLLAQGVQSLLAIPVGVGLAVVANEAVAVLLGDKWLFIVPFVQVLALASIAEAISTSAGYVLITMGKARLTAVLSWLQVFVFAVPAIYFLSDLSLLHLAWLRLCTVIIGLFLTLSFLLKVLRNLTVIEVFGGVIRPMIGASLMAFGTTLMLDEIHSISVITLAAKIIIGALIYSLCITLIYKFFGKEGSAEYYLFNKIVVLIVSSSEKSKDLKEFTR